MENGITINGKFYKVEWINDLVKLIIDEVTEKVTVELKKQQPVDKKVEKAFTKVYTVEEVAVLVRKSKSAVKRHIRIGILEAHKVGKPWLIPEESLLKYKFNPD